MRISDWSSDVCSSDLILRHLSHPLFLARFDLNAGNRLATADPSCHFLLALSHELAPFIVIAGEAFGRDRHCKCDMALRLAQLGVFRVLDILLPAESFGQIGTRFGLFSRVAGLVGGPRRSRLFVGPAALPPRLTTGRRSDERRG